MKFLDEINIGDKDSFSVAITKDLHNKFLKLSGDKGPIHTSDEFSKTNGFKKKIGYAFLLESFLSRLYGNHLPGGSSICIKQESKFLHPFYEGDELKIMAEVTSKSESTRLVEIKTEIFNQENKKIFEGKGLVKIITDKKNTPLYLTEDGEGIFEKDFLVALESSGVSKGDSIFVHSDISNFGKIGRVSSRKEFLEKLVNILKKAVGEKGNLIMPTFTYSFCKGEIFNQEETPSTVGILTEHFRKLPETKRSKDAIFSVSTMGPEKEELTKVGSDCFGESSIFEKLYEKNVKIVFLGETFDMTYLHFIEQKIGSDYRYIKEFPGESLIGGKKEKSTLKYNVRSLDKNLLYDFEKISDYLKENNVLTEVRLGSSRIRTVSARDTFNILSKKMKEDPYFLLKENKDLS